MKEARFRSEIPEFTLFFFLILWHLRRNCNRNWVTCTMLFKSIPYYSQSHSLFVQLQPLDGNTQFAFFAPSKDSLYIKMETRLVRQLQDVGEKHTDIVQKNSTREKQGRCSGCLNILKSQFKCIFSKVSGHKIQRQSDP